MAKISVTHFLDKRKKGKDQSEMTRYPIYVRLIYQRKPYNFPSQCNKFNIDPADFEGLLPLRQSEFDEAINREDSKLKELFTAERQAILDIVELLISSKKDDFSLTNFSMQYQSAIKKYSDILVAALMGMAKENITAFSKDLYSIIHWDAISFTMLIKALTTPLKNPDARRTTINPFKDLIEKESWLWSLFCEFEKRQAKKILYFEWVRDEKQSNFMNYINITQSSSKLKDFAETVTGKIIDQYREKTGI